MKTVITLCCFFMLYACAQKKDPSAEEKFQKENDLFLAKNRERSAAILSNSFEYRGLEVLYIQTGDNYYQWFGHSALRLVGSGVDPGQDLVVSLLADFNDATLDVKKAYYGGYEVLALIETFDDVIKRYLIEEGRYLDRYILPSTAKERSMITDTLRKWLTDPSTAETYSFRRNGCTALLLKLIGSGILTIDKSKIVFPVEVVPYLKEVRKGIKGYKRIELKNYETERNVLDVEELYEVNL